MNQGDKTQGLVLIANLCVLSFFPLLRACFRLRPARVYYFQASKMGLKIANWLKTFKIISEDPTQIYDRLLNDTNDNAASILRFEALNICLKNQAPINQQVNKCLPGFENHYQQICVTGIRKEWVLWLQELFFQLNRGKVLARENNLPTHNVILISSTASLLSMLNVDSKYSGGIKVWLQLFENKALLYLCGPVVYGLCQVFVSLYQSLIFSIKKAPDSQKRKALVGLAAVWGFEGFNKNRVDDFFWWRHSKVPPEQVIYMFERQDYQPTRNRLTDLEQLKVKSIALNPKYPGDAQKNQFKGNRISFKNSLKAFFLYSKLTLQGLLANKYKQSICSLVSWQVYKSEALVLLFKDINLRGIFHFHETGLEFINLAALQSNAARIGTHWSCFTTPNASSPRCHEVFFAWGEHDLKIILDSGSVSKNILISGCFLNEFSHKEGHERAKEAVQLMKNQGVRITLALFDNSLPLPNFYRFFLQWLIDDPSLGILIKSKSGTWESVCEDGFGGLVQQAMDSGRIFVMDEKASPADAALLSDFAVGITGISAIAVAGLQGAKVLYIDYDKLNQGALKPYGIFHSLGPNRCVFYDMESLKNAVLGYAKNPESNPNLGDVSPILDQIDPFRDGKASQRIGEYVTWYFESLESNSSKKEALRIATEKYAEKWGADKVIRHSN
jgi:hypothetical protein